MNTVDQAEKKRKTAGPRPKSGEGQTRVSYSVALPPSLIGAIKSAAEYNKISQADVLIQAFDALMEKAEKEGRLSG